MSLILSTNNEFVLVSTTGYYGVNRGTLLLPSTQVSRNRVLTIKDAFGRFTTFPFMVYTTGIDLFNSSNPDSFENGTFSNGFWLATTSVPYKPNIYMARNYDFLQIFSPSTTIWNILNGSIQNGLTATFGNFTTLTTSTRPISTISVDALAFNPTTMNVSTISSGRLRTLAFTVPLLTVSTLFTQSTVASNATLDYLEISSLFIRSLSTALDLETNALSTARISSFLMNTSSLITNTVRTQFYTSALDISSTVMPLGLASSFTSFTITAANSTVVARLSSATSEISSLLTNTLANSFFYPSSLSSAFVGGFLANFSTLACDILRGSRLFMDTVVAESTSLFLLDRAGIAVFEGLSSLRLSTTTMTTSSLEVNVLSSQILTVSSFNMDGISTNILNAGDVYVSSIFFLGGTFSTLSTNSISTTNFAALVGSVSNFDVSLIPASTSFFRELYSHTFSTFTIFGGNVNLDNLSSTRVSSSSLLVSSFRTRFVIASTFTVSTLAVDFLRISTYTNPYFSLTAFSTSFVISREPTINFLSNQTFSTANSFVSTLYSDSILTRTFFMSSMGIVSFSTNRLDTLSLTIQSLSTIGFSSLAMNFSNVDTTSLTLPQFSLSSFSSVLLGTSTFSISTVATFSTARILSFSTLLAETGQVSTLVMNTGLMSTNSLSSQIIFASNAFISFLSTPVLSSFTFLGNQGIVTSLSVNFISAGISLFSFLTGASIFANATNILDFSTGTTVVNSLAGAALAPFSSILITGLFSSVQTAFDGVSTVFCDVGFLSTPTFSSGIVNASNIFLPFVSSSTYSSFNVIGPGIAVSSLFATTLSSLTLTIPSIPATNIVGIATNIQAFTASTATTSTFDVRFDATFSTLSTLFSFSSVLATVSIVSTINNQAQFFSTDTVSTFALFFSSISTATFRAFSTIDTFATIVPAPTLQVAFLDCINLSTPILSSPFFGVNNLFLPRPEIISTIFGGRVSTTILSTNIARISTGTIRTLSSQFFLASQVIQQSSFFATLSATTSLLSSLRANTVSFSTILIPSLSSFSISSIRTEGRAGFISSQITSSLSSIRLAASTISSFRVATLGLSTRTVNVSNETGLTTWNSLDATIGTLSTLRLTSLDFDTFSLSTLTITATQAPISTVIFRNLSTALLNVSSLSTNALISGRVSTVINESQTRITMLNLVSTRSVFLSSLNNNTFIPYIAQIDLISSLVSTATLQTSSIEYINLKPSKPRSFLIGGTGPITNILLQYDGFPGWVSVFGLGNLVVNSICFNGSYWIAIGQEFGGNIFAYSTDSYNWTTYGDFLYGTTGNVVAWNGLRFVAGLLAAPYILTSVDGITWTAGTGPTSSINSLTWNGSLWVAAAGDTGTGSLFYSFNGLTWIAATLSGFTFLYKANAVATNNKLLLAGASQGTPTAPTTLAYSFNGITWLPLGNAVFGATTSILDIAWNGILFLAVSDSTTNPVAYSFDGLTWVLLGNVLGGNSALKVHWDGSSWWIGTFPTGNSTTLYSSPDGFTWSEILPNVFGISMAAVYALGVNSNATLAYEDQNLAIPFANVPFYPVSTNLLTTYTSSLLFNNTLTVDSQNFTVRINSIYPSSITSNPTIYDLDVVGRAKFSTLAVGTFDGISSFGPAANNIRLALTQGDAYKPTGTTWNITSDERIKEAIEDADSEVCYDTVKGLPLRRFKYKDEFLTLSQAQDKHVLGFLAHEVSSFVPKAVSIGEGYGYSDLYSVNLDQVEMIWFGGLQKTIRDKEAMESTTVSLLTLSSEATARISTLEGYFWYQGRM